MREENLFWRVFALTFLVKLALASLLPMSGDEAYFVVWAQHFDIGYYDHPPMAGWLLALLLPWGHADWLVRLPAVLTSSIGGWLIWRMLRPVDPRAAALAGVLYLLWPLSLLNVLMTTDTPLILFGLLSAYYMVRAVRDACRGCFVGAGVMLGLAFLSKYFAVLLGLAYAVWFVATREGRTQWRGAAVMVLSALPAPLLNLYWNYTHCWDNILFNVYNRNAGVGISWHDPLMYVGMTVYMVTPPVMWAWWRHRKPAVAWDAGLYAWLFALPLGIFGVLSLGKTIGLHWVLAFYPFLFLLLGVRLPAQRLRALVPFMRIFAALHVLVVVFLLLVPATWWLPARLQSGYVLLMQPQSVLAAVQPLRTNFVLATNDYSTSAVLAWHDRHDWMVYGAGSKHARQDDLLTDYRQLDGKNILVFDKSPTDDALYAPYFARIVRHELSVQGGVFYVVQGYGFRYPVYRDRVLREIKNRYYHIPAWLPHAPCYFCEKYFPGSDCVH